MEQTDKNTWSIYRISNFMSVCTQGLLKDNFMSAMHSVITEMTRPKVEAPVTNHLSNIGADGEE